MISVDHCLSDVELIRTAMPVDWIALLCQLAFAVPYLCVQQRMVKLDKTLRHSLLSFTKWFLLFDVSVVSSSLPSYLFTPVASQCAHLMTW